MHVYVYVYIQHLESPSCDLAVIGIIIHERYIGRKATILKTRSSEGLSATDYRLLRYLTRNFSSSVRRQLTFVSFRWSTMYIYKIRNCYSCSIYNWKFKRERERENENVTERYQTGNGFIIKYSECHLRVTKWNKNSRAFRETQPARNWKAASIDGFSFLSDERIRVLMLTICFNSLFVRPEHPIRSKYDDHVSEREKETSFISTVRIGETNGIIWYWQSMYFIIMFITFV